MIFVHQKYKIEFFEDDHRYLVNGVEKDSVTKPLKRLLNFDDVPVNVLEKARQKGNDKHKMIKFYHKGTLDHSSLTPELAEVLKRYLEWFIPLDYPGLKLFSEEPLYHPCWDICGTPDLILDDCLIDFKFGAIDDDYCGAQLAAYAEMCEVFLGIKIKRRLILFPDDKGVFKTKPYKNKNDYRVFRKMLDYHQNIEGSRRNIENQIMHRQGFINQLKEK